MCSGELGHLWQQFNSIAQARFRGSHYDFTVHAGEMTGLIDNWQHLFVAFWFLHEDPTAFLRVCHLLLSWTVRSNYPSTLYASGLQSRHNTFNLASEYALMLPCCLIGSPLLFNIDPGFPWTCSFFFLPLDISMRPSSQAGLWKHVP
jgi:hypothetical protein